MKAKPKARATTKAKAKVRGRAVRAEGLLAERAAKPVTGAMVKDLAGYLCKRYGAEIHRKGDVAFMRLIAEFLDAFGIQDKERFLRDYCLTLGSDIYLTFRVGAENPAPIAQQLLLGHEFGHVVLYRDEGVGYTARYAADSAYRAICEARCHAIALELYWLYTRACTGKGALLTMDMDVMLRDYRCKRADRKAAQAVVDKVARMVARGVIGTEVAQVVGKWCGWM